jgi:hypothetical protein
LSAKRDQVTTAREKLIKRALHGKRRPVRLHENVKVLTVEDFRHTNCFGIEERHAITGLAKERGERVGRRRVHRLHGQVVAIDGHGALGAALHPSADFFVHERIGSSNSIKANLQNTGEVIIVIEDVFLLAGVHTQDHNAYVVGMHGREAVHDGSLQVGAYGSRGTEGGPSPFVLHLDVCVANSRPIHPARDFGKRLNDNGVNVLFMR